jgi:hypothetical protein
MLHNISSKCWKQEYFTRTYWIYLTTGHRNQTIHGKSTFFVKKIQERNNQMTSFEQKSNPVTLRYILFSPHFLSQLKRELKIIIEKLHRPRSRCPEIQKGREKKR